VCTLCCVFALLSVAVRVYVCVFAECEFVSALCVSLYA